MYSNQKSTEIACESRSNSPHKSPYCDAGKPLGPCSSAEKKILEIVKANPVYGILWSDVFRSGILCECNTYAEQKRNYNKNQKHDNAWSKTCNRKSISASFCEGSFLRHESLGPYIFSISTHGTLHRNEIKDRKNCNHGKNKNSVNKHEHGIVTKLKRNIWLWITKSDETINLSADGRKVYKKKQFYGGKNSALYILLEIKKV